MEIKEKKPSHCNAYGKTYQKGTFIPMEEEIKGLSSMGVKEKGLSVSPLHAMEVEVC